MDDTTSGGGGGGSKRRERDDSQFDRRGRHVAPAAAADDDGKKKRKRSRAAAGRSPSPDSADDRAFFNEDDSDALAPSPSPSPPPPQRGTSPKPGPRRRPSTKFEELLPDSRGPGRGGDGLLAGAGAAAAAAELSLQRRLVKQLGLRGNAKKRALEQPEGLLGGGSASGEGEAKKKKKKKGTVPGSRRRKRGSSEGESEGESASDAPPLSDSDEDCFGLNAAAVGEEEDDASDEEKEAAGDGEEVSSSSSDDDAGDDESDSESDDESDSDAPPLSDSDDDCFGLNANLEDDDDSADDDESSGEEEEDAEEERDGDADLYSSSSDAADDDDEKSRLRGGETPPAAVPPPRTPQTGGQYLPPAARAAAAAAAAEARKKGGETNGSAAAAAAGSAEGAAVLRRVRGLLNRLAEVNLRGVSGDVASLCASSPPALVREALCAELVAAAARGPRASAALASAAAALVAAVAANVRSPRLAAEFAASTALALEEALRGGGRREKKERRSDDDEEEEEGEEEGDRVDSTSVSNLASLACALHAVGVLRPAAMFSLLRARFDRFDRDADVAAAAAVLRASGARLRAEDPAALREAVLSAASRAAEARAAGRLSARGEALLSLVLDVKNNRRGGGGGGGGLDQQPGALSAATMRWLRSGAPGPSLAPRASSASSATSGEEYYALHGVTWETLVSPSKRGQWWLPTAAASGENKSRGKDALPSSSARGVRLAEDDDDGGGGENAFGGGLETEDLLSLAAAQRMGSTPSRRACFCAAMGAADAADGAERLLRLPLRGAAARDVVRVPLGCALREASWNPYYAALLSRLARAKRAHRASLVLALRDELRDAAGDGGGGGGRGPRAAATLARLAGALVAGHAVPLSPLLPREAGGAAPADAAPSAARCGLSAGSDALVALLPPRRTALWRALLRHALAAAPGRAAAASPFERLSAAALAASRNGGGGRGGGGRPSAGGRGSDGDDGDLDGFAEARLEKRKRNGDPSPSSSAPQGGSAFPPLEASAACASLRSFIRRFVVPGVDGSSSSSIVSSSGGSAAMFGGISLDELTLRARGAERALAAGAKAGQSVVA